MIDGREAVAGEGFIRAVRLAQQAQERVRRHRCRRRQGEPLGGAGEEGRIPGRADKDPGGKLKGVEGVGVDHHERRVGEIARRQTPQDPGDRFGDSVDQGRPAEPGRLGQLLAPGAQESGHFPALAPKFGPEALGVGRPGPQGGAVPIPVPVFI